MLPIGRCRSWRTERGRPHAGGITQGWPEPIRRWGQFSRNCFGTSTYSLDGSPSATTSSVGRQAVGNARWENDTLVIEGAEKTPSGGTPSLRVEIACSVDGSTLVVTEIRDNGNTRFTSRSVFVKVSARQFKGLVDDSKPIPGRRGADGQAGLAVSERFVTWLESVAEIALQVNVQGQMAVTREAIGVSLADGNYVRPRGASSTPAWWWPRPATTAR